MGLVLGGDANDGRDGAKEFFVVSGGRGYDISEDGGRVEGARMIRNVTAEDKGRSTGDAPLNLVMEGVAKIVARLRTDVGVLVHGIADAGGFHGGDEAFEERIINVVDDKETFGGDAALACVDEPAGGATLRGEVEVCVIEDEIGIRATEFEDGLLDRMPRGAGDCAPCAGAAREGGSSNMSVFDNACDLRDIDEEVAKEVFRKPSVAKEGFDGERAAGDIGRVFEDASVAEHEGRGGETEHLPEGKIPWHDSEYDADGSVRDVAVRGVGGDGLGFEKCLGVLGIVITDPGAFVDLRSTGGDGFAHFDSHELGVGLGALTEEGGGATHA